MGERRPVAKYHVVVAAQCEALQVQEGVHIDCCYLDKLGTSNSVMGSTTAHVNFCTAACKLRNNARTVSTPHPDIVSMNFT
jgi:hypothetical protein